MSWVLVRPRAPHSSLLQPSHDLGRRVGGYLPMLRSGWGQLVLTHLPLRRRHHSPPPLTFRSRSIHWVHPMDPGCSRTPGCSLLKRPRGAAAALLQRKKRRRWGAAGWGRRPPRRRPRRGARPPPLPPRRRTIAWWFVIDVHEDMKENSRGDERWHNWCRLGSQWKPQADDVVTGPPTRGPSEPPTSRR